MILLSLCRIFWFYSANAVNNLGTFPASGYNVGGLLAVYTRWSTVYSGHSSPYRNGKHFAGEGREGGGVGRGRRDSVAHRLQALVYDILPSTTAVFSYAIRSRKTSANEQFFAGAQTVVSLLQTIQIKQGVSFIATNKVYTSTNKTTIV